MPALRRRKSLATTFGALAMCRLRSPGIGHGGDDFSGHAHTLDGLVSGHVVGNQPEKRRQCPRTAAGVGLGELPDGLGMAA